MMPKIESTKERFFAATTFVEDDDLVWNDMKIEPHEDQEAFPLGVHIYVPQCSYLGESLISLNDTYEQSGEDCLFIQELLRLCKEGRLQVKGK